MILYRTPGRSLTRPPRTRTMECSCRLWPTPGMYAVTSTPLVSRTRATLRRAEFGFLGVNVYTRVHTPRRWGAPRRAGGFVFVCFVCRPFRTSWAIVGTRSFVVDGLAELPKMGLRRAGLGPTEDRTVQPSDARARRDPGQQPLAAATHRRPVVPRPHAPRRRFPGPSPASWRRCSSRRARC